MIMKGIAANTLILLAIGVITMVVALYFLTYVTNFDALFLSNDQRILKQYSTCALAYCAAGGIGSNGQTSDEVNAVGCLKSEGGRCTLTCAQVEKEVYLKNNVPYTVQEVGGRGAYHYCGQEASLSFEFSGVGLGGTVPLASGQMDKIATSPQWVCKPIKIPFTDIEIDSFGIDTAGIQFHGNVGPAIPLPISFPQNCVILSGKPSPIFPGRDGCFQAIKYDKSYDSIYYTPLIEYDSGNQIIYPSAIYVDSKFTQVLPGLQKPECNFRNSPNYSLVSDQQILDVINSVISHPEFPGMSAGQTYQQYYDQLKDRPDEQKKLVDFINTHELADLSGSDNLIGNVLNGCKFLTQYQGKKIQYHVWAKPAYPTFSALAKSTGWDGFKNFIDNLLQTLNPNLKKAFGNAVKPEEDFATLAFSQLGGSCTSVILGRDLPSTPSDSKSVDVVQSLTIDTDQKTYPAGGTIKFSGQLVMTSGSASNREITVDYIFSTLSGILQSTKAVTDKDGMFSGQFKISSTGGGTGFVLEASFIDRNIYSAPFNIVG